MSNVKMQIDKEISVQLKLIVKQQPDQNKNNKSYDDSVKLKRTEMDPFRLG